MPRDMERRWRTPEKSVSEAQSLAGGNVYVASPSSHIFQDPIQHMVVQEQRTGASKPHATFSQAYSFLRE